MMTAGRDDPMMKRIVSALLLCAMLFTLTAAQAATADMKKAKVAFDLKTGKNFTCYTLYGGLAEGVPIKCKVTNYQQRLWDGKAQIFFRLTMTNAFEPTDEQIHSMVDNMSGDTIGGIIGYCFADYKTGMCLETENDFGVKVDKKEITVNKQKFEAKDGYWIRIPVETVYDLTVTFPKDYDGLCFGVLGLMQWIRRKSIARVDGDILLLGAYYILVILGYLLFEMIPINYRPILIDGAMEASYPSSTTLLVLSVMPTLVFQVNRRTRSKAVKRGMAALAVLFSAFMVMGRLVAGVHWLTDIVGSVLLSAGLYCLYRAAALGARRKGSA